MTPCSLHLMQGGPGTEPEPETGTVGTVCTGTERGTGTAGTVFQEPKTGTGTVLSAKLYWNTQKNPLLRGTAGTENRNRSNRSMHQTVTEPNRTGATLLMLEIHQRFQDRFTSNARKTDAPMLCGNLFVSTLGLFDRFGLEGLSHHWRKEGPDKCFTFRSAPKGETANGRNRFLQKSAVFCGFLRKSAVFLQFSAQICDSQIP